MSSRVLRTAERLQARPVVWQRVEEYRPPAAASGLPGQEPSLDVKRLVEEARREAYAEGEAAGRRVIEPVLERLTRAIEETAGLRARLRREAEADLVKLSLAIARRILHRELAVDPEAVAGLALVALERLQSQEIVRVRVHPDQAAALRQALERSLGAGRGIEILADPAQEPGGVVLETARGNLDASIETQLEEIGRGLADRLRRRS